MKYANFERLVIGIGALAILGSLLLSFPRGGPGVVETIAQIMLFVVLVVAVHSGRRAGLIAAILASAVYVVLRIQLIASPLGMNTSAWLLMVARIAAYGLVGVVGGELCARIKYIFARYDDSNTIDDWSRVFNQRYASSTLERARARFARYGEPFSIVMLEMSPSLTLELRPSRQRALVRGAANYVRSDIRMVDEIARLADGRFMVLLPHTPREGGLVVKDRLQAGMCQTLGAREESVTATCYGAAEDAVALASLASEIHPGDEDQGVSGVYTSAGSSTRNPADRRAASAAGSSTLSTSTAASPEVSTKQ